MKAIYTLILVLLAGTAYGQSNLPACQGSDASKWSKCFGNWTPSNGDMYVGEFKDGKSHGQGTYYYLAENQWKGDKYVGEFKDGKRNGQGTYTQASGFKFVGEYKDDKLNGQGTVTWASGEKYVGDFKDDKRNGQGTTFYAGGEKYVGEFKDDKSNGQGTFTWANGEKYVGEFKDGNYNGRGIFYSANGSIKHSGIYKDGTLVTSQYVDPNSFTRIPKIDTAPAVPDSQRQAIEQRERQIELEVQRVAEERRRLDEDKRQRELAKQSNRISITASSTQPDSSGVVTINIQTNTDTSSLKINGEELGGKVDGSYSVRRVARVGQETKFILTATDVYGNTDTKSITVSRSVVESKVTYPQLNPDRIKRQPERDAVAVIIGISNYKSLPKAEFAKDDAQVFYDYAIRALGVKPGNIKLLMDEQADAEEIYTAFKTWLPARVKSTTDVYVFYSGHGLPTQDGSGLYWLPQRANRDLISKTGILLAEVNGDIQASKPKSVTIFMDACYSGQARGGETLLASARPIALKSQPTTFPNNFTVISASQADQISSSSPELQHGIFSYYLMRGMEGEADLNKDGKITLDEIQAYLSENVGRQARIMNRQQEPQVIGDGSRVLVGR